MDALFLSICRGAVLLLFGVVCVGIEFPLVYGVYVSFFACLFDNLRMCGFCLVSLSLSGLLVSSVFLSPLLCPFS